MFDSHAHLCFPEFDGDREAVVAQARGSLKGVLVSSARYKESRGVLELTNKHPGFLYTSIGHHPTEGDDLEGTVQLIREHADRIHAIGEVGMDYHWEKDPAKQEQQREVFQQFIDLAKELKKPLVIHSWDAERPCFEMVRDAGVPAVFHCFTGKRDLGMEIANAGFWVSISTNVLFSKAIRKTARDIPLEKLLLETDSPFLDPDRERRKNTPPNIAISAKKIGELRGINQEDVMAAAWENAQQAFGLTRKH